MAERSNSPSSGSAHGSDRPYGLNIAKILQENGFSTIMSEFIDKSLFGDEIDDLATATKTQLCTHMAAHLLVYKDKFFDDELLRNFRMDFDGWTYKMFNQMGLFKKDFRSLFEHQGIKVPIMRNDASAMVALLTGYENKDTAIKTWTGEEIEDRLNMNLFHPRAMLRQRMARNTIRSPGASTPVSSTPVNHQQTVQLGTPLVQQNQPAQQNQLVQQTQPAQQSQPPPVSLQPMTSIPTTIQQNVAPPVQQQTSMVPSTPTVIQQNTPTVQPQTQQQRISTPYTDPQSQRNTYLVPPQGRYLTPLPFRQYTTIPSDTRIVTNVPLSQGSPDGLVPTLLVFGSYPRISFDSPPSATTVQRAAAMNKAMKALRQKTADRSVRDALNTRNGPNVSHILDLPLGSLVRVYREKNGWTGPYKLISIDNHDVTVDTGHGPSKFRTTTVQPYFHEDDEPIPDPELSDKDDFSEDEDEFIPVLDDDKPVTTGKRGRGRPKGSKNKPKITEEEITVQLQSTFVQFFPKEENETMMSEKEHHNMELAKQLRTQGKITSPGEPFQMSDETEIKNLIDNGVFAFEQYNDKTHGKARLFSSRMVREIKYDSDNEPYEKSRLVVQGYSDEGKKEILTQSPTIQRASQRIILALSPSIRKLVDADVYLRDITQAYTQSKVPLIRKIYARLPKELINKYPPNTIMVVIRPLYGLAEAGLLWFFTYHSHHLDVLKMNTSTFDPCLLITDPARADKDCFAVVGMQTDDTLFIGTPAFHTLENNVLVYKAKDVSKLTPDTPLNFNGCRTSTDGTSFSVFQKGQGKRLATIPASGDDRKDIYVQQRARGAYIASICQPEASYDLSRAAQNTEPEDSDYTELNKRLQWQIDNQDRGLKFVPLDLSTAAIYVFVDGSFANNKDLSSQIGYLICIGNEKKVNDAFTLKSNIVHWSSTKCKRVTRSVLASEIYGMVSGFDMAFCITQTTNQIIDSLRSVCDVNIGTIPLILCTDSYSLYEGVTKLGTTAEKRLMIDIMALRESYEAKEITEVRWINGHDNPADAMTKANPNKALEKMVSTNEVTIRVEGMVTRKAKTS